MQKIKIINTIRYKILKCKKRPLCDFNGTCKNLAFKEVYPNLINKRNKNSGWSYLCKKHFKEEKKRLNGKLVYCHVG